MHFLSKHDFARDWGIKAIPSTLWDWPTGLRNTHNLGLGSKIRNSQERKWTKQSFFSGFTQFFCCSKSKKSLGFSLLSFACHFCFQLHILHCSSTASPRKRPAESSSHARSTDRDAMINASTAAAMIDDFDGWFCWFSMALGFSADSTICSVFSTHNIQQPTNFSSLPAITRIRWKGQLLGRTRWEVGRRT